MELYRDSRTKRRLPLIPLRGITVFPYMIMHFDIGREASINALEEAMVNNQLIFLASQKKAEINEPTPEDFYKVGTISKIKQMLKLPGDTIRILVEGISRAKIANILQEDPFFVVEVVEQIDRIEMVKDIETDALMRSVINAFTEYIEIDNKASSEILLNVSEIDTPGRLADTIASNIVLNPSKRQEVLEAFDPKLRLETLYRILLEEIQILEIEQKISERVKSQINKVQKEYYLREQLKAIQKELGEEENLVEEVDEYKQKLKKLKLSKELNEKIGREISRLSRLSPSSAETGVIRSYIDWALNLPWNEETKDTLDIKKSARILDEDHYGLEKVKERILEYLAIRQLSKTMRGPILCLVGPPGVGKTSIAKSIARSLDRKFARMSLGGVRDEAEIRGHRRTYVGAIPGRIITSIRQVKSKNPVFLFDEVDKLASDFRGDPASALLEVLDPEQNHDFTDHYLEFPFSLENVMFITTANSTDTIPRPLLDRMEVIRIAGYTEEEKLKIAEIHLLPKQIKEHGLEEGALKVSKKTIRDIINYYTRESGVRNLERQLANLCRKAAKRIVEEGITFVSVTPKGLKRYLGNPIYRYDMVNEKDEVGVVRGLAWTPVGGDTLSVEVTPMKGEGKLVLTGQLGDVMKESAKAGISYIRSKVGDLKINPDFHKDLDIHIHIPEGAIPKDGPSAGIAMTTAVISALTNVPVYKDVAMTGEITLRGRILPIGGVKEKVLAANRAGIKKVILPIDNEKNLEDIPTNVKRKLEFVFAQHMDDVLKHAFKRDGVNESS
ncbi:MAG: endopeptidase La [Candidatus Alkaliphilus sp. MAG34]|nr:endopeptidase La [Clostridiales bacterium]